MHSFEATLLSSFPLEAWSHHQTSLAVSGGADSVALLRAMASVAETSGVKKNLSVITVNHCLRGNESDEDAQFVYNLGTALGVRVYVKTLDPQELQDETKHSGSLENAARLLRYRALFETCNEIGARFLATAHHRDDQLETTLFRLFRGTGLEGLRGVCRIRPIDESLTIIRPLLKISRADVIAYLQDLNQPYRTDSTNISSLFVRNRIRHELVPQLEAIFPNKWQNSLLRLSQIAEETENYFNEELSKLDIQIATAFQKEHAYRQKLSELSVFPSQQTGTFKNALEIPLQPLQEVHELILRRYFRRLWKKQGWPLGEMGSHEWKRLTQAVQQRKPANQFPGNIAASFPNDSTLRLERKASHSNA